MKEITINYLSHNRTNYSELMFYFLSKIKPENKLKLKLNVLATVDFDWKNKCDGLGIDYEVTIVNSHFNYLSKINIAVNSDTKYSVKLDEDCFTSNYVWDYLIENVNILDDEEMIKSPFQRIKGGYNDSAVDNCLKLVKPENPQGLELGTIRIYQIDSICLKKDQP
jgi:hypothetical protein